jgi:hypothetical protein
VVPCVRILPSTDRYIGFLTRCALSKPFPELSIVNIVKSMSMATGRIPAELAAELFDDSAQGDHLAYAGTPTTRPHSLRNMPFTAVQRKRKPSAEQRTRQAEVNRGLLADLQSDGMLRERFACILQQDNEQWDMSSESFKPAVCLLGAVRHRGYEKEWDCREDGRLLTDKHWTTNQHVFACCCSADMEDGSGVPVFATVYPNTPSNTYISSSYDLPSSPPSTSSQSSSSSSSLDFSIPSSGEAALPPPSPPPSPRIRQPNQCSQRAPFENYEDIAYGLVKRWIAVQQSSGPGESSTGAELSTMIAHVRIFLTSLEQTPQTGCPIVHQRSLPPFEDHYMLAKHIVCRITVSPMPNDASRFLVSHVV